jgi:hypothetical protein
VSAVPGSATRHAPTDTAGMLAAGSPRSGQPFATRSTSAPTRPFRPVEGHSTLRVIWLESQSRSSRCQYA